MPLHDEATVKINDAALGCAFAAAVVAILVWIAIFAVPVIACYIGAC